MRERVLPELPTSTATSFCSSNGNSARARPRGCRRERLPSAKTERATALRFGSEWSITQRHRLTQAWELASTARHWTLFFDLVHHRAQDLKRPEPAVTDPEAVGNWLVPRFLS
ncbi:MAG: hypothetical protein QOJ99_7 [Bryobacterales bacterium]|nr:hypothetical protein [Bryobacterales bacterium]